MKKSIIAGLLFGIATGIYLAIKDNGLLGLIIGTFCVIAFAFIAYFKLFSKIDNGTSFQVIEKSSLCYYGLANHFKDNISVGGKLTLSREQLIFQSNIFNFLKRHEYVIDVSEIITVEPDDSLSSFGNGLSITTSEGVEKFIVNKRSVWIEQIKNVASASNRL